MFGTYRFLLTLAVFQAHLWKDGWLWLAWDAVFSFYTLSGFLMTATLHETYGFTWHGRAAFCLNRFLRLYPLYYVASLAVLWHIWRFGPLTYPSVTVMPETWWQYLPWVTIIGHVGFAYSYLEQYWYHTLIFNAWSLNIEIVSYLLLAFYFGKTRHRLWQLFLLGVIAVTISSCFSSETNPFQNYRLQNHYGVIQAGCVPFACGGLYYFYKDDIAIYMRRITAVSVMVLLGIHMVANYYSAWYQDVAGLYISALLTVFIIDKLYVWRPGRAWGLWLDDELGRLAYPMFLAHWAVAAMLIYQFPALRERTAADALVFLTASLLVSGLLGYLVDRKIEQLRAHVKRRLGNRSEQCLADNCATV